MNKKYNGWTNYETWQVRMYYLDYWQESISDMIAHDLSHNVMNVPDLADFIKDDVWELEGMGGDSLIGLKVDLFNAAMIRVNWYELADHLWDTQLESVIDKVGDLITSEADPENETQLDDWITSGDIVDMTPQEIANEWDEMNEKEE